MNNETNAATLAECYASSCRFNNNGECKIAGLEIGKKGRCMNYTRWTKKDLSQYLNERGLSDKAVEQIISEAEKNGGTH